MTVKELKEILSNFDNTLEVRVGLFSQPAKIVDVNSTHCYKSEDECLTYKKNNHPIEVLMIEPEVGE